MLLSSCFYIIKERYYYIFRKAGLRKSMRFITLDKVEPGMFLGKAVFDQVGRMLIGKKCAVTQEHLDRLIGRGFLGLYIEDELSKDIEIEEAITAELREQGVECVRNRDIDGCMEVSRRIVEQIIHGGKVSLDLVDLRTYDDYTYRHSVNVAVLSTIIGMGVHLKESELTELCAAALMHDLGKIWIDEEILNKPARLTKEEFQIMKMHAQYSYDLIKERLDISAKTKSGVLFHHENEDGSGYPEGLEGEEIHLFARIIHVADVYDALTSKRPYKEPYSSADAIEYLMGGSSILFDRNIVDIFLHYVPVYPKGMNVVLSDGREGIIVENNRENILRPKIRLLTGEDINLAMDSEYRNITACQTSTVEPEFYDELERYMERSSRMYWKKILIIGAMDTNLESVCDALAPVYEFIWDISGEHAFKKMKEGEIPELIIIDIDMPGLHGMELIERIQREIKSDIPLMFLTSIARQEIIFKFREMNAREYVLKPYKPVYMRERIRTILEGVSH